MSNINPITPAGFENRAITWTYNNTNVNDIYERIDELYDPNYIIDETDDILDLDSEEPITNYRNHNDLIYAREAQRNQRQQEQNDRIQKQNTRQRVLAELKKEAEAKKAEELKKLNELDIELKKKHQNAVDYLEL